MQDYSPEPWHCTMYLSKFTYKVIDIAHTLVSPNKSKPASVHCKALVWHPAVLILRLQSTKSINKGVN